MGVDWAHNANLVFSYQLSDPHGAVEAALAACGRSGQRVTLNSGWGDRWCWDVGQAGDRPTKKSKKKCETLKLDTLSEELNAHVFDKLCHDPTAMRAYTAAGVKDLGLSFLNSLHGLPEAAVRKVAEMLITSAKVTPL
jgi:hypothetical protein